MNSLSNTRIFGCIIGLKKVVRLDKKNKNKKSAEKEEFSRKPRNGPHGGPDYNAIRLDGKCVCQLCS